MGDCFQKCSDPIDIEDAKRIHRLWQRWLEQAEQLHRQLAAVRDRGAPLDAAEDLARTIARARGLLQLTPERQALALEQARRGEVIDGRELRREIEARKRGLGRAAGMANEPRIPLCGRRVALLQSA